MKEFVEKLIERLEEKAEKNAEMGYMTAYDVTKECIKIVNQQAEEYKDCVKMCSKDCEVYDKEKHYCPKYCKVIRETVEEFKEEYKQDLTKNNQGWIPCSERLPEEETKVIVSTKTGVVRVGTYTKRYGYGMEEGIFMYMNTALAWQPLPEPYNPSKPNSLDKVSQEPKTRIDHIRSMSVEEMADAILDKSIISAAIDFCHSFEECWEGVTEDECKKCLIEYLNSPIEQRKAISTQHFEDGFNWVK